MTGLPRPHPERIALEGRYVRLEPLAARHAETLYAASAGPANAPRFEFLFEAPPAATEDIRAWIDEVSALEDRIFYAVIDRASGRCEGRQALMNIVPQHGTMELGSIYWGPAIGRTRVATEALYLHARYALDALGYRRFEWKCNDRNAASKRAALRFGFRYEGLFRQHLWVKGATRDTAWFSIIDAEWPALRAAYERWLDPANFDASGAQRERLATPAAQAR